MNKESSKDKIKNLTGRAIRSVFFWITVLLLIISAFLYVPEVITVSNSVGGKELPVYSVETDKKQVALSFDAAWGEC